MRPADSSQSHPRNDASAPPAPPIAPSVGATEAGAGPLADLDEWDADVRARYPQPAGFQDPNKREEQFRDYRANVRPGVCEFYRQNHRHQTVEFVRNKRAEYGRLDKRRMGIWEAMEWLNTLIDDSDPDTDVPQIEHCLQTAEEIRRAGHPRWFILAGLIHDLGKVLCLYGEPQWAVVGDTFPVGCAWSDRIVFPEFFAENPDRLVPEYQTPLGMYERLGEHCGLDQVWMSWGHDEYLYLVVRDYLPEEALAMIRYHSFYPGHRERAYDHLLSEADLGRMEWVRKFNPFDLYTKSHQRPDVAALRPFYEDLVAEFFPEQLRW